MCTYKLGETLEFSEFGDEMIIYNKETGNVHILNGTATEIIKLISEYHNSNEIVHMLFLKYNIENLTLTREQIQSDVYEILETFLSNGVIQKFQ